MLVAFAEHASLALTDARTVERRDPPGLPRLAHRAAEPAPADRPPRARARPRRRAPAPEPPSCSSTSTRSRTSTTASVTPAGDELLREAAKRLLACVRAADTAARFGGDEFVVLLEDVDEQRVARVANRILEAMNEPFAIQDREVFIGASIGIAVGDDERRRPAAQRRPRALPGEGEGQGPKAGLRARDARRDGRAPRARGVAGEGAAQRPSSCSTTSRSSSCAAERARRRRGAGALAAPDPRPAAARRVHPDRRGQPPDAAARALGAAHRLHAGRRVAAHATTPRAS